MKRLFLVLALAAAAALAISPNLWARGRGGGGGGRAGGARPGGMGGARGGGFTPSAPRPSRPSAPQAPRPSAPSRPAPGASRPAAPGGARPGQGTRPGGPAAPGAARPGANRPGDGPGAGNRASADQLNKFLDMPRPGGATGPRPGSGGPRPGAGGGAAADFLRGEGARPGQLPGGVGDRRPGAGVRPGEAGLADGRGAAARDALQAGQRPADRRPASHRPERIENRDQWRDNRGERRGEVWDQVQDNYPRLDFWTDHPNWAAWRINRPYRWATWGALTGWVGYGAVAAVPYSYGDNIYYEGDSVYSEGQPVATVDQYAAQAEQIADSAPATAPADAEWLPLGVFAMTEDGQANGAAPTLFLQLAISKEGVLSGLYNNQVTGESQEIEGMADKQSQRAAWTIKGKQRPLMETGLSNLTEDTAPALLHFADGQTQQWLLVRLPDPDQKQQR